METLPSQGQKDFPFRPERLPTSSVTRDTTLFEPCCKQAEKSGITMKAIGIVPKMHENNV